MPAGWPGVYRPQRRPDVHVQRGCEARAEQCGWLKGKYGISWQVVPTGLPEMLRDPNAATSGRAMEAMLHMKKIDIDALTRAYEGQ